MLREDKHVSQVKGEPPRRWYSDDYFDLIVWQSEAEPVFAFQLCYDRMGDEHALVWHVKRGFAHYRIDQGEIGSLRRASPMMMTDALADGDVLRQRFVEASAALEKSLAKFLLDRIDEWQADV